jgi:hypothetical protein
MLLLHGCFRGWEGLSILFGCIFVIFNITSSVSHGLLYFNVYVNGHLAIKDLDLSSLIMGWLLRSMQTWWLMEMFKIICGSL